MPSCLDCLWVLRCPCTVAWKFKLFCTNKLSQFQHSTEGLEEVNIINKKDNLTTDLENVSANESGVTNDNDMAQKCINNDEENDPEQEECDTCDRILKNNINLNEHQTNDNCGFGCTECGEYFRYKNDLIHLSLHPQSGGPLHHWIFGCNR